MSLWRICTTESTSATSAADDHISLVWISNRMAGRRSKCTVCCPLWRPELRGKLSRKSAERTEFGWMKTELWMSDSVKQNPYRFQTVLHSGQNDRKYFPVAIAALFDQISSFHRKFRGQMIQNEFHSGHRMLNVVVGIWGWRGNCSIASTRRLTVVAFVQVSCLTSVLISLRSLTHRFSFLYHRTTEQGLGPALQIFVLILRRTDDSVIQTIVREWRIFSLFVVRNVKEYARAPLCSFLSFVHFVCKTHRVHRCQISNI